MILFFKKNKIIKERWIDINDDFPEAERNIPKIIWMYWDSAAPNILVDFCINRTKEICSDFEVRVLNEDTVKHYLTLPDFNLALQAAHKADYIRLSLLSQYGGVWMDASIYLVENLDWMLNKLKGHDAFLFYSDDCTLNVNQPITENWLIIAPPKSEFIVDWLREYESCIFSENPGAYYLSYQNKKFIIQNIPNIDYLMCYVSAAIVNSKKKYNLLYVNSGAIGHYFNYTYLSNSFFIGLELLLRSSDKTYNPKLIKFTSATRTFTNALIKSRFYSKKSLLGPGLDSYLSNDNNGS